MGWLRLIGSLKLQVHFAKEPCKIDGILQERPVILRSLLIVDTPYEWEAPSKNDRGETPSLRPSVEIQGGEDP